jgi:hypothetical protein
MRATWAALLAAALMAVLAAPAAASSDQRALIAFLPGAELEQLQQSGMAVGLTSPTLGGYKPQQMAIDIGQGARISTRAYKSGLPQFAIVPSGSGARVAGWPAEVARANAAPGDVTPGLLATTIERSGGHVGYLGVAGAERSEALAAADQSGQIQTFAEVRGSQFVSRALALWQPGSLLVARLPDAEALKRLLAARGARDLVYVVEAPPPRGLRLLPTGVAGPGYRGVLRSGTTRVTGLITATDVAPTVLDTLGIHVPKKMQGERIESRAGHGAAYVHDLSDRLDAVLGHRTTALRVVTLAWIVLLAVLWIVGRREGLRLAARIIFLSALWVPALALLTAALRPSDLGEALLLALGALALGALTDRLLPWPAAPLIPAAVSLAAHTIDLAFGSHLISLSLAGPNPKGGSRFFGIGNELEITLAVTVLIGTGAGLTLLPRRYAPRGFAIACIAAAFVIGVGRLGADVGGVITLGAGGAAAVVASLPGGVTRRAVALAVIVPVLAVGVLIGLDLLIGGGAHLTRTVSSSSGPGDFFQVIGRRWRLSVHGLTHGTTPISAGLGVIVLIVVALRRRALLAPLQGEHEQAFAAGVIGVFFATVVGALANDSGPLIVMVGAASLLLASAYAQAAPRAARRRALG